MPTVMRLQGARYFFYSNEGSEPAHIHVEHSGRTAKVWIENGDIELARNQGFSEREIQRVLKTIRANRRYIKEVWDEFFSSQR